MIEKDADNIGHKLDNAGRNTCRKCGNGKQHYVHSLPKETVFPSDHAGEFTR